MNNFLFSVFVLLNLSLLSLAGNVLVFYAHDERSHIFSMQSFLERLVASNHSITVLETGPPKKPLDLGRNVETFYCGFQSNKPSGTAAGLMWSTRMHSIYLTRRYLTSDETIATGFDQCGPGLLQILNRDYDLIVIDEIFTIHGFVLTHMIQKLQNVPYISYGTGNISPDHVLTSLAMGYSPAVVSHHGTAPPESNADYFSPPNFYHRLSNTIESASELAAFYYIFASLKSSGHLGFHEFDPWTFIKSEGMHVGEYLDRFRVYPMASDYKSIGSHCRKPSTLSKELADFVNDPKSKGTIYLAFGSLVDFDHCPEEIYHAVFDAINAFSEYRVIFAAKIDHNRFNLVHPPHVKIVKWAPQSAVLAHEKTKIFVTHGGLKSFKEALCSGTPIVVVPIFAEQHLTAIVAIERGIGRVVNKFKLSSDLLKLEIDRVLTGLYAERMKKYKSFFLDRIVSSVDEANFYAERLMKLAGKNRTMRQPSIAFKRQGIQLGWFEFYQLDWILAVFGIGLYVLSA